PRRLFSSRPSRLKGALSLDHVRRRPPHPTPRYKHMALLTRSMKFIQRSRVLSLYRTIIRATAQISDTKTRAETRAFVRAEFERHRGVTDLVRLLRRHLPRATATFLWLFPT